MKLVLWSLSVCLILLAASAATAQPSVSCSPCTALENGSGTANFPALCPYQPCCGKTMHIVSGLPPGTTIEIQTQLFNFTGIVSTPGGPMGGETVDANANLLMQMTGTGTLSGFSRNIIMPVLLRFENAPRTPLAIIQPFDGYMARNQGQLPPGDPDFDLLRITAGNDFGLPSPGHTTFSLDGFNYSVESFFDITYRIDFIGHPGGPIGGLSGSTTDAIRMYQGCPRWLPGDSTIMHFAQHPNESGWNVNTTSPRRLADDWKAAKSVPIKDLHWWGSFLSGQPEHISRFFLEIYADVPAGVDLPYSHPGGLLWSDTVYDYVMTPITPGMSEGWFDPYTSTFNSSDHVEYWQYDVLLPPAKWFTQSVGTIYWLSISAQLADTTTGHRWGWKSTLDHYADDACYQPFPSGSCLAPDNGTGTATMPAICPYDNNDLMYIINGLPPASTIEIQSILGNIGGVLEMPGGLLGGMRSQFFAQLQMKMNGTGAFSGYTRTLSVLLPNNLTDQAPRLPATSPQSFGTDFVQAQGQLPPGDPDFDLLRITAGSNFGLPSPGHTTLTAAGTMWNCESFFDLTYRIDFVGHPGGPFSGLSGSTTGTARIRQGGPVITPTSWIDMVEPPAGIQSLDLAFVITGGTAPTSCCIGNVGNVDCDPTDGVDISDLTVLIDNLFISFTPLCCVGEANCDGDPANSIDIGDLTALIDNLFITFTPLPPCI